MSTPNTAQSMVTRTLRAAVKIGDDYLTLEETISLPPTATNDQIAQAIDAGQRMYAAQRAALDTQMQQLRSHVGAPAGAAGQIKDPDAPASDKQRAYLDFLARELNISSDELATIARGQNVDLPAMTKREASEVIDVLKKRQETGNSEHTATNTNDMPGDDLAPANDEVEPVNEEPVPAAPVQVIRTPGSPRPMRSAVPVPAAPAVPSTSSKPAPVLPIGDRVTQRQVRALDRIAEERGIGVWQRFVFFGAI